MSLTVVVDGGGSGCRLGAFDSSGTLRATASDGPASLSLGAEQAWAHIRRGISSLASQCGKAEDWLPAQLYMGLAGSLQATRREQFLALLPQTLSSVLITDGHAQLLGASGGQPGACLAIGTGSVLHWLDEAGRQGMVGGWGFPMGDEGSGAWLGCQLVSAYLWHRDTRHPGRAVPCVFQALEDRIGSDVSAVQTWSTNTRSTDLASLAPIIVAAAGQADAVAMSLLARGAKCCDRLLQLAPDTLPIYLVGGLRDIYAERLAAPLGARVEQPLGDALSGLYALSRSHQATS